MDALRPRETGDVLSLSSEMSDECLLFTWQKLILFEIKSMLDKYGRFVCGFNACYTNDVDIQYICIMICLIMPIMICLM